MPKNPQNTPKVSDENFPFVEVVKRGLQKISWGLTVYQMYTCDGCGKRLAFHTKNTFYQAGRCERCHHVTDLLVKGCHYFALRGELK